MTDERFERLADHFGEAVALEGAAREELLRRVSAEDPDLGDELRKMLQAHEDPEGLRPSAEGRGDGGLDPLPRGLVGRRIAGFRLERLLAGGGMGVVYEALQENPPRRVALKLLHSFLSNGEMLRRFRREAEILGSLHHPGIAHVYEAGTFEADGGGELPYIAMELVQGKGLRQHLREHPPGREACVALFVGLCAAVDHAHERGVVHRDLKPGNVLVDGAGHPKVLDFGVAHLTGRAAAGKSLLTTPGLVLGTLAYMSPEQARGDIRTVGPRTDVYALGVMLYEALTGRLPHDVRDRPLPEAVRILEQEDPTTLARVDRTLRGDLDRIVGKALEKNPARRYATAGELGRDLERHLNRQPVLARPPSRLYRLEKQLQRHRALFGAILVVVLTLVAAVLVSLRYALRSREDAQVAERALAEARRGMGELHDVLSLWRVGSAGREFALQPRLDELRIGILDRIAPGFAARWKDIIGVHTRTRASQLQLLRDQGEALLALGTELERDGRGCAAELLVECGRRLIEDGEPGAARFLEGGEELLRGPGTGDPRLQLARALLLDGLALEGRHDELERLARTWLDLGDERASAEDGWQALFRSRLGASLLARGRNDAAREELQRAEGPLLASWAGTWFSARHRAARVALEVTVGDVAAADAARGALAEELLGDFGVPSADLVRAALPPTARPLLQAAEAVARASGGSDADLAAAFERYLDAKREPHGEERERALALVSLRLLQAARWCRVGPASAPVFAEAAGTLSSLGARNSLVLGLAWQGLGRCAQVAGDFAQAEEHLRRALRYLPGERGLEHGYTLGLLGVALREQRRFPEAADLLLEGYLSCARWAGPTAERTVELRDAMDQLGRTWGLDPAATSFLDRAQRSFEGDDLALWFGTRARLAARRYDRASALDYLRRGLELGDHLPEIHQASAVVRSRLGDLEGALAALDRMDSCKPEGPRWEKRADSDYWRARTLQVHGQLDAARALVERALGERTEPARTEALHRLYADVLLAAGEVERALEQAQRAYALEPGRGAEALARALLASGRPRESVPYFELVVERALTVDGHGLVEGYARALHAVGHTEEALAVLEEVTARQPHEPYAWRQRAAFLSTAPDLSPDRRREGLDAAERAARLSGRGCPAILATLASSHAACGQRAAAISILDEALALVGEGTAEWVTAAELRAHRDELTRR